MLRNSADTKNIRADISAIERNPKANTSHIKLCLMYNSIVDRMKAFANIHSCLNRFVVGPFNVTLFSNVVHASSRQLLRIAKATEIKVVYNTKLLVFSQGHEPSKANTLQSMDLIRIHGSLGLTFLVLFVFGSLSGHPTP